MINVGFCFGEWTYHKTSGCHLVAAKADAGPIGSRQVDSLGMGQGNWKASFLGEKNVEKKNPGRFFGQD